MLSVLLILVKLEDKEEWDSCFNLYQFVFHQLGNVKHIFLYQLSTLIYSPLNVSYFYCICWFCWLHYLSVSYVHVPVHVPWCACAVRGQLWEVSFLRPNLLMFWGLESGHQANVASYCSQKSWIVYLLDMMYLDLMYLTCTLTFIIFLHLQYLLLWGVCCQSVLLQLWGVATALSLKCLPTILFK